MGKPTKTVKEKLLTKLNNFKKTHKNFIYTKTKVKFKNKILLEFYKNRIEYKKYRYYSTQKEDLKLEDFSVTVILSHESLKILSGSFINPPSGVYSVRSLFQSNGFKNISMITIGSDINQVSSEEIKISLLVYKEITAIAHEEQEIKKVNFKARAIPIINEAFNVDFQIPEHERDYSLLISELLAADEIPQADIIKLCERLENYEARKIVVEQQVHKQVSWLLEKLQIIIDDQSLNTQKAKKYGRKFFNFPSSEINGPEQLLEKILFEYGKYAIFGVPAILQTKKYVVSNVGLSRSQFDLILVNHLSDLEVIELKKPNTQVLDFDSNRCKFYASKELSIAVSQAERYISAVYRENDEEYKIDGIKIRNYLNDQLGGEMNIEICRPTALIIIGTYQSLCKSYKNQTAKVRKRLSEDEYDKNSRIAYKELKTAYKNIKVLTYSELLENARVRLKSDS